MGCCSVDEKSRKENTWGHHNQKQNLNGNNNENLNQNDNEYIMKKREEYFQSQHFKKKAIFNNE